MLHKNPKFDVRSQHYTPDASSAAALPLLSSHPRVPSVVLVLLHEFVVEFLETVHDRGHVLLRWQDGGSQMEYPKFKQDRDQYNPRSKTPNFFKKLWCTYPSFCPKPEPGTVEMPVASRSLRQ